MEAGQIVQVNGKPATVITVGDGVVHLEQDGQAISVHPDEVTIPDAPAAPTEKDEAPGEAPTEGEKAESVSPNVEVLMIRVQDLRTRVRELETQAERIERMLHALTAGPKPEAEENPAREG